MLNRCIYSGNIKSSYRTKEDNSAEVLFFDGLEGMIYATK